MGDLLARFKDHLVTLGISDGSIRNYLSDLNHFQTWLNSSYPKHSFADLNSEHPLAYRTYLTHELEAPVSSVNRRLSSLRQFFTWAVSQNLLSSHPMQGLSNISIRAGNTEVTPQQSAPVLAPLPTPAVASVSAPRSQNPRKFPVKAAAIALLTLVVLTLASLNAPNFLSGGVISEILTVFRTEPSETIVDPQTTAVQEITQNKRLDTLDKSTQELSFEQQRLEQDQQSLQEFAIGTQGEVENFDSTTENSIQNSSFELNASGVPLKWQYFNFSSGSNTVVTQDAAHTGANVLKFSLDGIKYGGLTQSQSKTRSDSASALSVWVKGSGLSYNGLIKLGFKDDTGKYAAFQDFYLGGSFGWQRLTVSANAGGLYPAIEFRGYSTGSTYLDDWQLTGGRNQIKYAENKSFGQGSVETTGKAEIAPVLGGTGSLGTALSRFGSLYLSGATIDSSGNVSISGTTISKDIKPLADKAYDLGSSSYYYRTVYAQSIIADGTTIGGDQTILGNLTVAGTSTLIGNVSAGSNLTVSGTTTLTGLLTSNGGITTNNSSINAGTGAISGGSIAGATLTTTGNTSVGGVLTVSSTINTNTFNASSLSFSGSNPLITTSSLNSGINLEANGSGLVNIGAVSTGDINIGGGSGSTGCTIFNSNGNLTCTGNILGAATGTVGYWSRAGTTLSPATSGDSVTTSGNISTTGSGTITSAGLVTASNGLTLTTGALNLTSTSGVASLTLSSSLTAFNVNSGLFNLDTTNSRVGIGTSSPGAALDVNQTGAGDIVRFAQGGATKAYFDNSGNFLPSLNAAYDIGSPGLYWDDGYFDNITANNINATTTTIAGTTSSTFTINTDNATTDLEDMDLIFFRGTATPPNALFSWKSTPKEFQLNYGTLIYGQGSVPANAVLTARGASGQTGDIFRVQNSTPSDLFKVGPNGNITADTDTFFVDAVNNRVGVGDIVPSTKFVLGGTGSANGITFGDDAIDSVNLYRSAANTLKTDDDLVIGATGNGKITVGVVDPYLIENTGTFQAALEFRTTATAGADDFVFTLGGAERARLTETGNLTILGTLTAQSTSTSTFAGSIDMQNNVILNIGNAGTDFVATTGALNLAGVLTANGGITLGSSQTFSASSGTISTTGLSASTISTTSSNLTLSTATSGTLALTSAGALNLSAGATSTFTLANVANALNFDSNTLSIDALNNRVGIGTSAPDHLLSITQTVSDDQTVNVLTGSSSRYGAITLGRTATELQMGIAAGGGQFANNSVAGDVIITNKGGGKLFLGTGNSAAFQTIDASGNVGIGTSTPLAKLNIYNGNLLRDIVSETFTNQVSPGAPTVAIGTATGLTGTFNYQITFVTASGETEGGTVSANVTVANQKIDLSAIPTGTSGVVTARKIYRSTAGPTTPRKLVTTLNDNTTTAYTDNIADGSLGIQVPAYNTTASIQATGSQNLVMTHPSGKSLAIVDSSTNLLGKLSVNVIDPYLIINSGDAQSYLEFRTTATAGADDFVFTLGGVEKGRITEGGNLTVTGLVTAQGAGTNTFSGTVDMQNNVILNIGNAGTDFVATTGALNLAGVLTANGGITLGASQTFSASSGTISATGLSASTISTTSSNLTLSTVTSGTLFLTSAGALNLSAGLASTFTLANVTNAFNFDANTLSVDALNNRVGIGNDAPGTTLDVTGTGRFSTTLTASSGFTLSAGALNLTSTSGAISATGLGASTIGTTSANLTLSTSTSGILALTSAGALNLSAGAASTFTLANVSNAFNFDADTLSIDALNNRIGIGLNNPATKLDITGLTISTDADNTIGVANLTNSLTKNDTNTRTFSSLTIKPTFNTGASNTTTTYNVLRIDTVNTAVTGLTTNLISAAYGGTENFKVKSNGDVVVGSSGTGKLTVGTVDPLYNIDGVRYSTYAPSMLGVKEEITGDVSLTYDSSNNNYSHTINLSSQPQGSDLWVFARVSDPDVNMTTVLVSANTSARVWYLKDASKRSITFFSDRATSLSYRLTAPRFDHLSWGTLSEDQETVGMVTPAQAPVGGESGSLSVNSYFGAFSENFNTVGTVTVGDLLSVDPASNEGKLTRSVGAYDSKVTGIATSDGPIATVTSAGRVQVRVSVENGNITPGDHLTSSATKPGFAMKATQAGRTIGVALQPLTGIDGTILVSVAPSWFDPSAPIYNPNGTVAPTSSSTTAAYDTLTATTANITNLNVGGVAIVTDTSGNLKINGNIVVTGKGTFSEIRVNGLLTLMGGISAPNGVAVNLGLSKAFEIKSSTGETVAQISDEGVLITKSAQINELKVSTVSAQPTTGTLVFRAGGTSMLIETTKITGTSKVIVTFKGNYAPATRYWTSDEVSGESFTLHLDQAPSSDVSFNWWIVN